MSGDKPDDGREYDTPPPTVVRPSYDEIQQGARLTQCRSCRLWFWMTHPQEYCIVCRQAAAPERDRRA